MLETASIEFDRYRYEFFAATCLSLWVTVWSRNSGRRRTKFAEKLCKVFNSFGIVSKFVFIFCGSKRDIQSSTCACCYSRNLYFCCFSVSVSYLVYIVFLMTSSKIVLCCKSCLCIISILLSCISESSLLVLRAPSSRKSSYVHFELRTSRRDFLTSMLGSFPAPELTVIEWGGEPVPSYCSCN